MNFDMLWTRVRLPPSPPFTNKKMPVFTNKTEDTIVFTSPKVASSTLDKHAQKGEIFKLPQDQKFSDEDMADPSLYKIMLVRDPYERLESYYRRTFFPFKATICQIEPTLENYCAHYRDDPWISLSDIETVWGRADHMVDEKGKQINVPYWIRHAAEACYYFPRKDYFNKEVKFEDFILKGIANGYHGQRHLDDQVKILKKWKISPSIFDKIIKIESGNFALLEQKLQIKLYHENRSAVKVPLTWTPEMKEIVYERYKTDFEAFQYKA